MRASVLVTTASLVGSAVAGLVPRAFKVPDIDFDDPSKDVVRGIQEKAFGKFPDHPIQGDFNKESITALQLIAFTELFEVAYFKSLLKNITEGVPGYETDQKEKLAKIFGAVLAQEELHAIGAINTLQEIKAWWPKPCKYVFPYDNLEQSIRLAEAFTVLVLGALQDAGSIFAEDNLPNGVKVLLSIAGQEGEQAGFYRDYRGFVPSEKPFLTFVPGAFAYSILQNNAIDCPFERSKIALPVFPPLRVNGRISLVLEPKDQELYFEADLKGSKGAKEYVGSAKERLWLTYTTGQQIPFSVEPKDLRWEGSKVTFKADFPYDKFILGGFSHAALTFSNKFDSQASIVDYTLAAPAVIQVKQ